MKKPSTWLIIAGILLILVPVLGSAYNNYKQERLYNEFLHSEDLIDAIGSMDEAFSESVPADPELETPIVPEDSYRPTVLGRIIIPAAAIDILLLEGTTAKDLNWGAGHIPSTPMPGEVGNCAIAGHRNYTFGSYFSRLDEVKVGDHITIEYKGTEFEYEVYKILTVLPTDSSVLAQTKNNSIVTLITCTPRGSNTHRLIVHGKLV